MQGILLIGMPYVGKSTIGRAIAKILGFGFHDGDDYIEKIHPDRQKFLDEHGDEKYIEMEGQVICTLPKEDSILAPGGSIIYSEESKDYLKDCFKVYLDAPLHVIEKRITEIDKRGIVKLKRMGLNGLYDERKELFRNYCDVSILADGKDPLEIARHIVRHYALHQLGGNKSDIGYVSTNGASKASFSDALSQGLAPDRGLFVPTSIPAFTSDQIALMKHLPYSQIAFCVVRQFANIPDKELLRMCEQAYTFDIPIENHDGLHIARMDQGPTASFKDFAAQLLSRMMRHSIKGDITLLTATSGDTGGAVGAAFSGLDKVKAIILMPENEVTDLQRRQMTTIGKNITAIRVRGKFDDCQALAKQAFSEIKGLSSANSICIGRLIPQVVYYFYIHSRTGCNTFAVPSGNFGNLVSGLIAKRMGLPVRFVAAVNENDEVPRYFHMGNYKAVVPSRTCISNAMNVGNPSNLARLVWLYGGKMDEKGNVSVKPDMEKMKKDILTISITDEETKKAIKDAYAKGIVLEPHGAVGYAALGKLTNEKLGKTVLLETAHPAKFPEELDKLGINYTMPKSMQGLDKLKEHYLTINNDFEELKKILKSL